MLTMVKALWTAFIKGTLNPSLQKNYQINSQTQSAFERDEIEREFVTDLLGFQINYMHIFIIVTMLITVSIVSKFRFKFTKNKFK